MTHQRFISAVCLGFATLAIPVSAAAQDAAKVVIMKVENVGADASVAAALETSLTSSVESHPDLMVASGGDMTIQDLILTAGCGKPDATCMEKLKEFIPGDRLVFGSVVGTDDGHEISLKMYDFGAGKFVAEIESARATGDAETGTKVAPALADGLVYGPVGSVQITIAGGMTNLPVTLDGQPIGNAPGTIRDLPLGQHVVTVRDAAGNEQSRTVILRRGDSAQAEFTFEPAKGSPPRASSDKGPSIVPGVVTLGLGVVGVGLGVFSSLQVDKANTDNEKLGEFVDPNSGAFSSEGAAADAQAAGLDPKEIEDRGKRFQTLQFVGYSVGAVGIGVGIYLIARSMGGSEKADESAWRFDLAPSREGVSASLSTRF